ncbi:MAG: hypothetical protein M3450_20790 [Actinomycetota bacterium]|nr:hypothetical protein [Actinomycetota bacterium]
MERTAARRYLCRLALLHTAPLLFCLGILIAVLGAPRFGVPAVFVALVMWTLAVVSAAIAAWRERGHKPMFGPGSVSEDTNMRMGWADLAPAAEVLGIDAGCVRRIFITTIAAAAAAAALSVVVGTAGR